MELATIANHYLAGHTFPIFSISFAGGAILAWLDFSTILIKLN
ncbi:hypothetical protein CCP3SC5AM1_910004 [Gammaproteobacteria bacterium]